MALTWVILLRWSCFFPLSSFKEECEKLSHHHTPPPGPRFGWGSGLSLIDTLIKGASRHVQMNFAVPIPALISLWGRCCNSPSNTGDKPSLHQLAPMCGQSCHLAFLQKLPSSGFCSEPDRLLSPFSFGYGIESFVFTTVVWIKCSEFDAIANFSSQLTCLERRNSTEELLPSGWPTSISMVFF